MNLGFANVGALPVAGLDFSTARWGISRDLDELRSAGAFGWTVMCIAMALPAGALLLVLFARSFLALVPLGISAGLFGLWFLYYATDWFSNPGQGAWMRAFSLVLAGWVVLLIAAFHSFRRRQWFLPFRSVSSPR